MRPVKFRELLDAVRGSGGLHSEIAKRANCAPATVSKAIARWPALASAVLREEEEKKDFAETKVFEHMNCEDPKISLKAATWFLERKARDRGYGNKTEISADINGIGTVSIFLPHNGRDDAGNAEQPKLEG